MERLFKISPSQCHKIMGKLTGLTEVQLERMRTLELRKNDPLQKPLTENMKIELADLIDKSVADPELPQTCKTYLHEWYAGDEEEIYSKYTEKGNYVEGELINFMAEKLGYGLAHKVTEGASNEYFVTRGCDVKFPDLIVDVKAPWNNSTFHKQVIEGKSPAYQMQLECYCHIYDRPNGMLFIGLMDTPEEVNYNLERTFDHIPDERKWIAYKVPANPGFIDEVIERVKLCREYLIQHDKFMTSQLGRIH